MTTQPASPRPSSPQPELRIGLLGLDMSHAVDFTRRLNRPDDPEHVSGGRVVAGWPGGSDDFELSRSRVERFTREVRDTHGVEILASPEAVAEAVDLLFITAADGRVHRSLFERTIRFRRPTFIDKPLATSLDDARTIFRIAAESRVPVVSCSTIRLNPVLSQSLKSDAAPILGCDVFGPMPEEPTQPGLFWYGIHSVEVMNVVMGRGCQQVRAYRNDACDLMTATWDDGRVATFRGLRNGSWKFGLTLHRASGSQFIDLRHNSWFVETLRAMLADLPNGKSFVDPADTLEIIAISEAANASRPDGKVVRCCDIEGVRITPHPTMAPISP